MPEIDPKLILVDRANRQRQENIADIDDLRESIALNGIINPLIVRRFGEDIILVAGERRLKAALVLNLPEVPVRYFDNLTPVEAEIIELEENLKRKELSWRDQVKAIGRIHNLNKSRDINWPTAKTAQNLGITERYVNMILLVYKSINSPRLAAAEGIVQAHNILQRFAERKAESIVGELITTGASLFGETTAKPPPAQAQTHAQAIMPPIAGKAQQTEQNTTLTTIAEKAFSTEPPKATTMATTTTTLAPVICANFHEWVANYSGPKFSLIHCDFPYGNYKGNDSYGSMAYLETEKFYENDETIYWELLKTLTTHLDKIMSYSAHMLFWFNMNFYVETVAQLRKTGLMVHDHPFIWLKTGGPGGFGVVPGEVSIYPRRTYDTALLCMRGNRPLAKVSMGNAYAAPTVGNKIHPSQKPEPMLRYFLQMLVDETTTMLDPTCGSAAALRAAEDLGAKQVLGLELAQNYAAAANQRTLQARILRQAGTPRKED